MTLRKTLGILVLAALASASLAAQGPRPALASALEDGLLAVELAPELGESWAEARVGRLVLRSAAEQRSLRELLPAEGRRFEAPAGDGCGVVLATFGPDAQGVTRTSRLVVCPDGLSGDASLRARLDVGGHAGAKAGGPIEIRPLTNPALLRPGRDLVVRLYLQDRPSAGVLVAAEGEDGGRVEGRSDGSGIASLTLPAPGAWTLRYRDTRDGTAFVAELAFEVLSQEDWAKLPMPPWATGSVTQRSPVKATGWRELGPAPIASVRYTGRAAAIAPSPRRGPRYFAGSASGGVWLSTNAGRTWQERNAGLPTLAIGALAVDPVDDNVLYAGSGEANNAYHSLYGLGLYRSTNGGKSWQVLAADTFAGRAFSRLVVSPFDRRVIWAAVGRAGGTYEGVEGAREHPESDGATGIFRSRDSGRTWQHLRAGAGLGAFTASDVDLDPRDERRVYASLADPFGRTRNGVYRSRDGGTSFEPILLSGPREPTFGRISLAVAPSSSDRLYALVARPASRATPGGFAPGGSRSYAVYRSEDGGDSWTRFASPLTGSQYGHYYSTIVVHPEDPDTFFVGGLEVMRSRDGGATFSEVTPPHVDIHDMAFDRAGRLLVADDGGVDRSDDLGNSWKVLHNGGMGAVQFYPGLSIDPSRPWIVLAGTQDNGTTLRTSSGEWFWVTGGDGGHTAIHPQQPNVYFAESQGSGQLYRSDDFGLSWVHSATGIDPSDRHCFLPPVVFDPEDPTRLLYATHRVYESTDTGRSWRAVSDDLTGGDPAAIQSLVIAPASSNVVYAATNDGRVLVSSNGGSVWDVVLEGVGGWPRVLRQLAVDPKRPSQVYVADMRFGGQGVLASLDRGRTWRSLGAGLPDVPVNTVAVHRRGTKRYLFAGTDQGVYLSRDFGKTWAEYGKIPRAPVMDLVVDAANGRLVASTLGRGAWEIDLPE